MFQKRGVKLEVMSNGRGHCEMVIFTVLDQNNTTQNPTLYTLSESKGFYLLIRSPVVEEPGGVEKELEHFKFQNCKVEFQDLFCMR